jgi:hypothetical protein
VIFASRDAADTLSCSNEHTGGRNAVEIKNFAVGYAKFYRRSHDAGIRVYDDAGNLIETHEQACNFIMLSGCAIPIARHRLPAVIRLYSSASLKGGRLRSELWAVAGSSHAFATEFESR